MSPAAGGSMALFNTIIKNYSTSMTALLSLQLYLSKFYWFKLLNLWNKFKEVNTFLLHTCFSGLIVASAKISYIFYFTNEFVVRSTYDGSWSAEICMQYKNVTVFPQVSYLQYILSYQTQMCIYPILFQLLQDIQHGVCENLPRQISRGCTRILCLPKVISLVRAIIRTIILINRYLNRHN